MNKTPVTNIFESENFKDSIFLARTDPNKMIQFIQFIRQLKMKHYCWWYDLLSIFLKRANTVVSEWFALLFNRFINEGIFSDSLKIACIITTPKIRNSQSSWYHRPISILPTIYKWFEKLLCQRVYSYKTMQLPHDDMAFALAILLTKMVNEILNSSKASRGFDELVREMRSDGDPLSFWSEGGCLVEE